MDLSEDRVAYGDNMGKVETTKWTISVAELIKNKTTLSTAVLMFVQYKHVCLY